jgi:8-amino-7-oxononanoate synthase
MKERLRKELKEIREKGNYREIRYLKPLSASRILYNGKEMINLCSNSYLSLHNHPDVVTAAHSVIDEYGAGTCSSRSVSGSIDLYALLENDIALFKGYEKALMFSNGYMANIAIVSTLLDDDDTVYSDELNHSSIIDAIRLSGAEKVIYRHLDMDDLERRLQNRRGHGQTFIISETVFSMDGDVAPLDRLYELKRRYGAHLIIDEAHATGVFGETGRGVEEVYGLSGAMDVQMGTFGKALGSFGAFVLGDPLILEYLVNRARTFMYTTALPASALAAARAALQVINHEPAIRKELWDNISYVRNSLSSLGFDLQQSQGPIVPIVVGEDAKAVEMQKLLLDKGVFLQAIRPPTVPTGTSRLRLTIVRGLEQADIERAIEALAWAGRKVGIIT